MSRVKKSITLPPDLTCAIHAEAERLGRGFSWVVERLCVMSMGRLREVEPDSTRFDLSRFRMDETLEPPQDMDNILTGMGFERGRALGAIRLPTLTGGIQELIDSEGDDGKKAG